MKFFQKIFFLNILILFPTLANAGGLAVFPNRIEMNDKQNNAEVRLINKSDEDVTYRISLQNLRMNENGVYQEVENGKAIAGENFAQDFIRFSPRRITLKPNQSQAIRVLFLDRGLVDGEYRTHMLFREEPPLSLKNENNIEKKDVKDKKISIVLKPLFGVSIPVIFQKGNLTSAVEFTDISINKNQIDFTLKRSGNKSEYGDVEVLLKSKLTEKKIAELNGVSLLHPYESRKLFVEVKDVDLSKIDKSEILLRFTSKNTAKILAESFIK